jgi:ClpP class serine protease
MKNYAHLSARVLNTPLLVEPGYARVFFSALAGRLGIHQLADATGEILTGEKLRMSAESFEPARERNRPYEVIGGVGLLPISGSLVHKSGHVQPYSGTTGYDGIIARAAEAFADSDVLGVMMDLDTPGGEVAGCFDTARTLRQLADAAGKPLWALCYDMNCSAGMALASSAHHRLITQTGIAGSIGVVMAHSDYSKMLDESGINVTLIHSGSHKIEGNPYEALPKDVLQRFQSSTDQLRQEFGQLVSGFTGLSLEAVLATEAATYRGQEAIDVGLADELINGHEAITYFSDYLSRSGSVITGATMSTNNDTNKSKLEQQTPQKCADTVQTPPATTPAT